MMYEEFATKLKEELERELENVKLVRHKADKVNGKKDAFAVIKNEGNIAPEVYIEEQYKLLLEGYTFNNVVFNVKKNLEQTLKNVPDIPQITFADVKDNLFCAVINMEQNKELLKDIPHENFEDLAVIARFRVGDEGSFIVSKELCRKLKMTEVEIMEIARKNTEKDLYECREMRDIMMDSMRKQGVPEDYIAEVKMEHEGDVPIFVLSNKRQQDGAVAIISQNAMSLAAEITGEDCYVIPSSRHEVLLIPKKDAPTPEELREMVKEANMEVVEKEDRLSDHVYEMNLALKRVTLVDFQEKEKKPDVSRVLSR